MSGIIVLPAVLDIHAAETMQRELLARRGQSLVLDASGVERLGGLSLQVLLSAVRTWAADAQDLSIAPVSEPFVEQCRAFGAGALIPVLAGEAA